MSMDRRKFIRLLGLGAVGAAVVKSLPEPPVQKPKEISIRMESIPVKGEVRKLRGKWDASGYVFAPYIPLTMTPQVGV